MKLIQQIHVTASMAMAPDKKQAGEKKVRFRISIGGEEREGENCAIIL